MVDNSKRKTNCVHGVCNPQRTQGLKAPAPEGEHKLVNIRGPGVFIAAAVSKQGGSSGHTFVNLDIDGKNVSNMSFGAAEKIGLIQHNPYGIVLLKSSSIRTFTIGFPSPLRFEKGLQLTVTVNEAGIDQILANVIYGID